MQPHPLAERYPLMEGAEFEAFKADIQANAGPREPIRTYHGMILDGRNRYRACVELGIDPSKFMYEFGGGEEDAARAVDSWNLHRRHLTVEFRRKRVTEMKAEGWSNRRIAAVIGVDPETVRRDLQAGAANASPDDGLSDNPTPQNPATPPPKEDDRGRSPATPAPAVGPAPAGDPAPPAPAPPAGGGDDDERPPRRDPPVAPKKVQGKDGKLYPPTRPPRPKPAPPTPVVAAPPPPPPPPPRIPRKPEGVVCATEVINRLKLLPVDDPQRVICGKMIRNFLESNF